MPYSPDSHTPFQWQNAPSTGTPLDAAHLEAAEQDLVTYTQTEDQKVVQYFEGGSSSFGPTTSIVTVSSPGAAKVPGVAPAVSVDDYIASTANVPAAVQAAINAATANGTAAGHVKFTPGKTYVYAAGSVPTIPANLPGRGVIIDFTGATIQLSTTVPRAFDWPTAVVANTLNYEIIGGTVDANWVGGQHHTVCGTYRNGSVATGTDVNIGLIAYRRVKVINLLTDANTTVNHRRAFMHFLTSSTISPTVAEVLFEDCDVDGGNAGFEVLGANAGTGVQIGFVRHYRCRHRMRAPLVSTTCTNAVNLSGTPQSITVGSTSGLLPSGVAMGTTTPGSGVAPTAIAYTSIIDGVTLGGCTGATVTLPAGSPICQYGQNATFGAQPLWFPASNYQTGSFATVKHVTYEECEGYYSADVGTEIDNQDYGIIDRCHFEDAFGTCHYHTNFTTPTTPDAQVMIYRNTVAKRLTVNSPSAAECFKHDGHSNIPLGSIKFEGSCLGVNLSGVSTTQDIFYCSALVRSIDLDGLRCVIEGFNYSSNTTSLGHVAVSISTSAVSGTIAPVVNLGRMSVKVSGTRTGSAAYTFNAILFTSNLMLLESIAPTFDIAITGVASGSNRCIEINGSGTTPTMRGTIRGLQVLNMTGDGAPRGVMIRGTSVVTIPNLFITECDFSGMSAGGNEIFYVDTTNKPLVRAYSNIYKTQPAPTTWSAFTTATGFVQSFGWDAILQFAQGSGAGITAIDFSTNGGTTYVNLLTQAAGALPAGFDQTLVLPGGGKGFLKVTFATTQPTINVVPLNP